VPLLRRHHRLPVAAYQLFGDITFLNAGWAQFHRTAATMMDANGFGIAAMLCAAVPGVSRSRAIVNGTS
jgi:hypothetical protein